MTEITNPIVENATHILTTCVEAGLNDWLPADRIKEITQLEPKEINDAIDYLESIGAMRTLQGGGTAPYTFALARIESKGRFLYHELKEALDKAVNPVEKGNKLPDKPINPIGSPYGFTENDWSNVALQKRDKETLFVVMGLQFKSDHYDTTALVKSIGEHFNQAIQSYNIKHEKKIQLRFEKLEAGYGTHLFNSIAASIIGSDIAVFDISNHNPNVMIELGVSLTWGIRVLVIREKTSPDIPSDISGQPWIKYEKSGSTMLDEKFLEKLEIMIGRAIASK